MIYDSKHWLDRIRKEQPGFLESVIAISDHMVEVMCRKQLDYGPDNINNAHGGPLNGLLVRMGDKYERIKNLSTVTSVENEPLVDSFTDLANYCIIALMVLEGTWPKGNSECVDDTTNDTTTTVAASIGSSFSE